MIGTEGFLANATLASANIFMLPFKLIFHDFVELLLSGYKFFQIYTFPFNKFRPLGRLRVTYPLLRGKYRFSSTVAYMKKPLFSDFNQQNWV